LEALHSCKTTSHHPSIPYSSMTNRQQVLVECSKAARNWEILPTKHIDGSAEFVEFCKRTDVVLRRRTKKQAKIFLEIIEEWVGEYMQARSTQKWRVIEAVLGRLEERGCRFVKACDPNGLKFVQETDKKKIRDKVTRDLLAAQKEKLKKIKQRASSSGNDDDDETRKSKDTASTVASTTTSLLQDPTDNHIVPGTPPPPLDRSDTLAWYQFYLDGDPEYAAFLDTVQVSPETLPLESFPIPEPLPFAPTASANIFPLQGKTPPPPTPSSHPQQQLLFQDYQQRRQSISTVMTTETTTMAHKDDFTSSTGPMTTETTALAHKGDFTSSTGPLTTETTTMTYKDDFTSSTGPMTTETTTMAYEDDFTSSTGPTAFKDDFCSQKVVTTMGPAAFKDDFSEGAVNACTMGPDDFLEGAVNSSSCTMGPASFPPAITTSEAAGADGKMAAVQQHQQHHQQNAGGILANANVSNASASAYSTCTTNETTDPAPAHQAYLKRVQHMEERVLLLRESNHSLLKRIIQMEKQTYW
jgi:hypothetical protein